MDDLRQRQSNANCCVDVTEFVRPYLRDCVDRIQTGFHILTMERFLATRLHCNLCYHQELPDDRKHVGAMCEKLCCNEKRCQWCFHKHEGYKCVCKHTSKFLRWVLAQARKCYK